MIFTTVVAHVVGLMGDIMHIILATAAHYVCQTVLP